MNLGCSFFLCVHCSFFLCVHFLRKFIVKFLFAGHPIMIVTEYMANGSLDTFLRVRYCRLSKTY